MEKSQSKKKTRQTRRSSKENKNEEVEPEMEGANIGEYITYDVLRMILEYSNAKDLSRAAMVCRSWNEAVKKEMQTRTRPQNKLYDLRQEETRKTFTDHLHIRPSIGLLFMGRQQRIKRCDFGRYTNDGCLCHRVPPRTNCLTIWNYGLVHDNLELEGDVLSALFLPQVPGVKIKCFTIRTPDVREFRITTNRRSREKLARKFFKISPKEDNIKALILLQNQDQNIEHFDDQADQFDAKQILKAFLSQQANNKDKISVWGGFASKLTVCTPGSGGSRCDRAGFLAGLSICGAGVSTWSTVLDSRIKTKEQLEKELTVFRDAVKLRKDSIGFMFACCGRGEEWYNEKDVEPKAFRKFFPNVPLVGSFGGGEFGVTTIPQECSKTADLVYEYSTIFLIVSYGPMGNTK